jgi:hypothetical protein
MRFGRWSVSLIATVGVLTATFAGAFVWLLVSDPVTGAAAIDKAAQGQVGPIFEAIGAVIVGAIKGLFKFL